MKVSTTSFLLASLYGSALAAPVSGDALKSLTSTAGLGNAAPGNVAPVNDLVKGLTGAVGQPGSIAGRDAPIGGNLVGDVLKTVTSTAAPGNVVPGNDLAKGLTGAVGQPGRVVGRAAPIGGTLVGDVLKPVTSTAGLGNAASGNVVPVNDLTKGLTGAVGQPGSVIGRDGEQKASVVLPNYQFVATDHTADVDIRADATNVHARNLDAHAKGIMGQLVDADAKAKAHPFAKPPADVKLDTLVDARNADITTNAVADQTVDADANVHARNLDAHAKGIVGQLIDNDAAVKAHPFAKPPVDVNADVLVDAGDSRVAPGHIAQPTATDADVTEGQVLPTVSL